METPLHHAVKNGQLKDVEYLLENGADLNAQNNAGHTPLHMVQKREILETCLSYADDRTFMITDKKGRNFLHLVFISQTHYSVFCQELNMLYDTIDKSHAKYSKDYMRRTPLHYAYISGYTENCTDRFYFEHINDQDIFGRTALHYAAINHNKKFMDILETKKANGKIQDKFGKTAREYLSMEHIKYGIGIFDDLPSAHFIEELNEVGLDLFLSDSTLCEAKLHQIFQDIRDSVDVTSYVNNIYCKCRFDYTEQFTRRSKPITELIKKRLCERVTNATASAISCRLDITFAAIQSHVEAAMKYLADKISVADDQFACEVVAVGSAHEGTKIGLCNEFDYNFVLTKLSRKCKICYSPKSQPGFVLVKSSTSEYDKNLFNNNGTLNTRIVKFKFEFLVKRVLSSSESPKITGFEFIVDETLISTLSSPTDIDLPQNRPLTKPHMTIQLAFTKLVNGYHVMHKVSVDIVPALQINDWWPEDARRQDFCQTGECLIVFTQPQNKYPWVGWTEPQGFISFARAESRLIRESPQVVKAAYMVVKCMSSYKFFFTRPFSSHVIKTALLWCLDDGGFSNCSSCNSDEVNGDELLLLVRKILRRLLCFAAQDYVPSYFMPKCRQPVWLEEEYLKQFHMLLYQHGLTYENIFSLSKQQLLEDYQLNAIKDLFTSSHAMYWTVMSDTDELELFVPSTINPVREIEYRHIPTSLRRRRQLKTELYNRADRDS